MHATHGQCMMRVGITATGPSCGKWGWQGMLPPLRMRPLSSWIRWCLRRFFAVRVKQSKLRNWFFEATNGACMQLLAIAVPNNQSLSNAHRLDAKPTPLGLNHRRGDSKRVMIVDIQGLTRGRANLIAITRPALPPAPVRHALRLNVPRTD